MRPHARAGRPEAEDDPDLALAKMLQSQEQAWLAMGGGLENMPSPGASPAGGGGGQASGAGGQAGVEGEEELDDEELARRFQEQEEREFQARLLALAGVGPAGGGMGGGGGAGDGGSEGYGSGAEEEGEEDDVDPDAMSYEELTALGEAVGTVSKGIAQADIDALPQQSYYEVAGTTAGVEEQCPICRMEFEPEDAVKVLPLCRHYYHPPCVGEWLRRNKICCICNKEVLEEGAASKQAAAAGGASSGGAANAASGVLGERRQ